MFTLKLAYWDTRFNISTQINKKAHTETHNLQRHIGTQLLDFNKIIKTYKHSVKYIKQQNHLNKHTHIHKQTNTQTHKHSKTPTQTHTNIRAHTQKHTDLQKHKT